jgi:hypothetical protein
MSKISLNTFCLGFLLLAACAPTDYAKQLVAIAVGALTMVLLQPKNLMKHHVMKLFVTLGFVPGLAQALYYSPADALRFAPIILLTLGFPYGNLIFRAEVLRKIVTLLILWLFGSQVLIALNFTPMMSFRESWYPIEENLWNYGSVDSLIFEFKSFRAGGLYYNPNVLALMIILLLFAFYYLVQAEIMVKKKRSLAGRDTFSAVLFLILTIAGFSLWLTGSRTALGGLFLLGYVLFSKRKLSSKSSFRKFQNILLVLVSIFVLYEVYFYFVDGFISEEGSARIKFEIFSNYLENASILQLLFGGTYDLHFDAEYGYWLGAAGISGIVSILSFLTFLLKNFPSTWPLVGLYLLMSIGNSLFYGLLSGVLLFLLVVLAVGSNYTKHRVPIRIEFGDSNLGPIKNT